MMPQRRACVGGLLLVSLALTGMQILYVRQARREQAARALCAAVESNNGPGVLLLLRRGADPNAPYRPAPRRAHVLGTLRAAFLPEPTTPRRAAPETLLDAAATGRRYLALWALLRRGADPNAEDEGGRTPLMKMVGANRLGDPVAVRILVDGGADINRKNRHGMTALMWAVWDMENSAGTSIRNVETLLDCGADINARDGKNNSALTGALRRVKLLGAAEENRVVFFLAEHGADDAASGGS